MQYNVLGKVVPKCDLVAGIIDMGAWKWHFSSRSGRGSEWTEVCMHLTYCAYPECNYGHRKPRLHGGGAQRMCLILCCHLHITYWFITGGVAGRGLTSWVHLPAAQDKALINIYFPPSTIFNKNYAVYLKHNISSWYVHVYSNWGLQGQSF